MEKDPALICPRPRIRRACESCRSRKIRCLPDTKGQGTCRRCVKLGLDCRFQDSPEQHCRKPQKTAKPNSIQFSKASADDVVSRLFQSAPAKGDEVKSVREKHLRIFQEQFFSTQTVDLDSASRASFPPDQLRTVSPETECADIQMQEVDELLSHFRQRHAYFPFVTISAAALGHEMAERQPFLLLAILTVCSARKPRLHRRTEERFRRILSDKIIVQGEKSLEYVQGLLVYLAWYPFHLRPTTLQQLQFLRIAIDISSDLKLSEAPSGSAAWSACLGCYYLDSLFSVFKGQAPDGAARDFFRNALPDQVVSDLGNKTEAHYALFHKLLEDTALYERELRRGAFGTRAVSQPDIDSLLDRLHDLECRLTLDVANSVPMLLKRKFVRARIVSLSMRPVKKTINVVSTDAKRKNLPSTVYQHSGIQSVTVCFNEVESFLETFLSIPFAEYHQFSIREWFQLIFVIVTASRVCIANGAAGDLDVAAFQARSRMKMLIYLESLTQRMGTLSVPTAGCPDVFYMFAAVLKILIPLYAPRADSIGDQLSSGYENDPTSSSYQTEDTISAAGTSLSRCPVASGSIKETDFWRELDHTESFGDFNPTDAQATHPGDLGLSYIPPPSPGWASIFSEWVMDFNLLE